MICRRCGEPCDDVGDGFRLCVVCYQDVIVPALMGSELPQEREPRPKEKRIAYERAVPQPGTCPEKLKPFGEVGR